MNKLKITILLACFAVILPALPVRAQTATMADALTVAENWLEVIIQKKGGWGDANSAFVEDIQEFKRENRTIGYFCNVSPVGYIVLSIRRELAPVKAYSARTNIDPESDEGMTDLIKGGMERILDKIEEQVGPLGEAQTQDVNAILEINYSDAWDELEGDISLLGMDNESGDGDVNVTNYQEGDVLLTTNWHQSPPYNDDCPWMDCANSNGRAIVGCVATAGAQLMRYWYWPPYGEGSPYNDYYDWANMPDSITTSSPQAQIDAVAELNAEVGQAVNMVYGCTSSGAYTYDMEGVYENQYRYSTACARRNRPDYTAVNWFNLLKTDLNYNRPLQYRIPGHSIVCDGWQEVWIDSVFTRQYHMNYGWSGTGSDAWYTLDALSGGNPADEYVLEDIIPVQALGNSLLGTYAAPSFPYRYFYLDTTATAATFLEGQYLQFLPGIKVISAGILKFQGTSISSTRLFSRGDRTKGARIYGGAIAVYAGGGIKFE